MKKRLTALTLTVLCSSALMPMTSYALTFNSDGSIVQNDGTVVQRSAAERYQEALEAYRAGEKVTGFPTARTTTFLGLKQQKPTPPGYFGADIVENGAPLFPLPSQIDQNDPVADIAQNLGLTAEQFTSALVVSSSEEWRDKNNITPDALPFFESNLDEALASEAAANVTQQLLDQGINAVNGTDLTAEQIQGGALAATVGIDTAIVNASPEALAAYDQILNETLAAENGLSVDEMEFVNRVVNAAGVSNAAEAAAIASQASQLFNSPGVLAAAQARAAANEATRLNEVADQLQSIALSAGTEQAQAAAAEALQAAEAASIQAQEAGERAARQGAESAAANAAEEARQAAVAAAGRAGETAAATAANAAASEAYAAAQTAALAAGASAQQAAEAAAGAAQEAATQAATQAASNAATGAASQAAQEAAQQAATAAAQNAAQEAATQAAMDAALQELKDVASGKIPGDAAAAQAALDGMN